MYECKKHGKLITFEMIDNAVKDLYNNWDLITDDVKQILNNALKNKDLEKLYLEITKNEQNNKSILIDFDNKYPDILNEANIKDILKKLK